MSGLFALLDDVAALCKVAASSIDDTIAQATKAGAKAAGVVVDDAAVTPQYVVGFSPSRELPMIYKITLGSLKNKIVFLLPIALMLSYFASWLITPLLMAGGLFLCYEACEKIIEYFHHRKENNSVVSMSSDELEKKTIKGAIKTDLILSAEIMAISLATIVEQTSNIFMQAGLLAIVGIGITLVVYGAVALIVIMDDFGLSLAKNSKPLSTIFGLITSNNSPMLVDSLFSKLSQPFGIILVKFMPILLKMLSIIGIGAMLWVGGGIIVHGFDFFGIGLFHFSDTILQSLYSTFAGLFLGMDVIIIQYFFDDFQNCIDIIF